MSCLTLICITGTNFLKFELIKAHLRSFRLFSGHLQAYSFEPIQAHSELIQNHSEYILGFLSSFRLIQAHFELIQDHFDYIQGLLSLFRLTYVYFGLFRVIQTDLSSFRLIRTHLGSFRLFQLLTYAHLSLLQLNQVY